MIDVVSSGHYVGDCRDLLRLLPDACVQACITSPPYWGLRDYGNEGQIGLEATPEEYVRELVAVFAEVRRVLRDDGTLWLNLGDSYASMKGAAHGLDPKDSKLGRGAPGVSGARPVRPLDRRIEGLKPKDLVGIPWRVAFALQADGWYLRADIIWHKPNPMPESVADRPTKAHEYVFLLSKSATYHYNADAVAEVASWQASGNRTRKIADGSRGERPADHLGSGVPWRNDTGKRNARSVWTIATQPYSGAHFATMPPRLAERCVLAGSRPGDLVLDPFFGSGTTGAAAEKHGRRWIGFDLGYQELAKERTAQRSLPMVAP